MVVFCKESSSLDAELDVLRALREQHGIDICEEIFVFDSLTPDQVRKIEEHDTAMNELDGSRFRPSVVTSLDALTTELRVTLRSIMSSSRHERFFAASFGIDPIPLASYDVPPGSNRIARFRRMCTIMTSTPGCRVSMHPETCMNYYHCSNTVLLTTQQPNYEWFESEEEDQTIATCAAAEFSNLHQENGEVVYERGRHKVRPMSPREHGDVWVPEILDDTDAIAADIHRRIMLSSGCREFKYVAVSPCCGSALAETKVLAALKKNHGVDIVAEIFMDKAVKSRTVINIDRYVKDTASCDSVRQSMPKVVVSFDDLSSEILNLDLQPGSETKLLVFGIHAQMGKCREVCMFSRLCDALCTKELIHPGPFLNYMHDGNRYVHEFTRPMFGSVPGASSGLRVFSGPWSAMTEWEI